MYLAIKRIMDIIVALMILIVSLPVTVLITILLFIANAGRPFFIQPRPGKGEKVFRLLKFKTMNDKKDDHGNLLPDAQRMTPIGNFVRKTSLDEIPQLINVLKGDMSIIGPRPLLIRYLPLYSDGQRRRHSVRPGITGWAQVNGRNTISWEKKFELDIWYVNHMSFETDIKIILTTIKKVLGGKDINSAHNEPMPEFKGTNNI